MDTENISPLKHHKRRSPGEGSLIHRKDGRWMARFMVVCPDGTRIRRQIILKDRQQTLKRMREEMALEDKGMSMFRDNRTLEEYLEYWLEYISAPRIRRNTQYIRTLLVRKHIISEIGKIQLFALRPIHVRQMLSQLEAKGAGQYTLKRTKQLLSTALKDAMKMEFVNRNVAELVDTPRHQYKERNVWSKSQVLKFLDYLMSIDHRYYSLFLILFNYGLRKGEVQGLRWQDIDFDQNVIHIRQAMAEYGNTILFDLPKTPASVRDLPLLPKIREVLLKYRVNAPSFADDLLFHSERGHPVNSCSLRKTFKSLSRHAGLPEICLHEIRHTVATLLNASGVTLKDAQAILGQNDINTTFRIYTHATRESKTNAMNTLAGYMA